MNPPMSINSTLTARSLVRSRFDDNSNRAVSPSEILVSVARIEMDGIISLSVTAISLVLVVPKVRPSALGTSSYFPLAEGASSTTMLPSPEYTWFVLVGTENVTVVDAEGTRTSTGGLTPK